MTEALTMPRSFAIIDNEEMVSINGGNPIIITVTGMAVTFSYFTFGQGERDAAAWIRMYGKTKAMEMGKTNAFRYGAGAPITTLVYWLGFQAESKRW